MLRDQTSTATSNEHEAAPAPENPSEQPSPQKASGLSGKVYSGISWTFWSSGLSQILALVRSMVLARLLTTDDFGISAMALTAFGAVCVLTNIGTLGSGMVAQFEDEEAQRKYLNTLWSIELARSLVIGILLTAFAKPTANFYGEVRLVPVLFVLAWVPLIISLHNIGLMLYTRDVRFGRTTILETLQTVMNVIITIGAAWVLRSYWALVWGQLAAAVIFTVVSFFIHPFRPRLEIDKAALRTALNFGKHAFLISLCTFVITTADNVLVARLLGPAVVGAYVIAYSASSLLSNVISHVFGVVFFALFAQIYRDRPEDLKATAARAFSAGSLSLTLITAPMILLAPEIITLLYGTKWLSAVEPLRILAVVGFVRGILNLLNVILMGVNRPDIESRGRLMETAVFLVVLYPLVKNFGTSGAAVAGLITFAFSLTMRFVSAWRSVPQVISGLGASLLCGFFAVASSVALTGWLLNIANVETLAPRFFLGLLLSVSVSAGVFFVCLPQSVGEVSSLLRRLKRRAGGVGTEGS